MATEADVEATYKRTMKLLMQQERKLYLVAMGSQGGTYAGFRQWVAKKYPTPEKLADALAMFLTAH